MYPKLTYLLLSMVFFLVCSCDSNTIDDISLSKGVEMTFNVSDLPDLSRGSITTALKQFDVYGDFKSPANESSTPAVIFNKTKVEYKNGVWGYDGTQYWMPNYEYSFVALSPGSIFETTNAPRYLNSQLSFDCSIPESGSAADILTATHRRLYVRNGSDPALDNRITLTFRHLLSLIKNISPAFYDTGMSSDSYVLFHKVEFSGVNIRAHVDILPAPRLSGSSTSDMEVNITGQENGDYSIDLPMPVKVENNAKNVDLFADDYAIITLPQTFAVDSKAEIILYYTTSEDTSMNQVSLPLNNLKWESGKSYIYKFTVEKTGVIFDSCEINPWAIVQGEDITVD